MHSDQSIGYKISVVNVSANKLNIIQNQLPFYSYKNIFKVDLPFSLDQNLKVSPDLGL